MVKTLDDRTDTERKLALIDTAILVHGPKIKLGKFLMESRIAMYKFTFHREVEGCDGLTTNEIYEDGFLKRLKARCPECGGRLRFIDINDSNGHCNNCHKE